MDPPAAAAGDPLPQVPIFARAEAGLKPTDLCDSAVARRVWWKLTGNANE